METEYLADFTPTPFKKVLLENRESEVVKNTKEEKIIAKESSIKKPTKALTPYIAFLKDFKENHGNASFKELGKIWNEISIEEKQKYVKIADDDMNRYKKEMENYLELNVQNNENEKEERENNEDVEVAFPLTRIKNMLKVDEDNKLLKKNVLIYLEQATELFGEYLLKEMTTNSIKDKKNKKKKLESSDLVEVIKKNKKLTFLRSTGLIDPSNPKPAAAGNIKTKEKSEKPENSQKIIAVSNNKKIDDYFKKIK